MRDETESMKEPTTPEELMALHKILRADPQRYLRIVNEWIRDNPKNSDAYFSRHFAWMKIGEPRHALDDLNRVAQLGAELDPIFLMSRGMVHRHLGEYQNALQDFNRADTLDPKKWETDIVFGLLFQADSYARLGDETRALATCERMPEDFWTPGFEGAPGGSKTEVAAKLRGIAAAARQKRGGSGHTA